MADKEGIYSIDGKVLEFEALNPVEHPKQIEKFVNKSQLMQYVDQSTSERDFVKTSDLVIRDLALKMNEIIDAINEIRHGKE